MVPCPVTAHTLTSREARAMPVWMYPDSWARPWSPRPHRAAQAGPRCRARSALRSTDSWLPRVLIFINGSRLTVPAPPTLLPCSVAAVSVRSRSMIASRFVCSTGHVDVDGLVRHGGDDIVVGAGNSRVGARVRLARPYTTWAWPARVTWPRTSRKRTRRRPPSRRRIGGWSSAAGRYRSEPIVLIRPWARRIRPAASSAGSWRICSSLGH